jgi:hypothetical protein
MAIHNGSLTPTQEVVLEDFCAETFAAIRLKSMGEARRSKSAQHPRVSQHS